jgi:hypothetical protein
VFPKAGEATAATVDGSIPSDGSGVKQYTPVVDTGLTTTPVKPLVLAAT